MCINVLYASQDWRVCQQQLNPHGRKGMNRRVLSFDPATVHPQIAARVREILEEHQLSKVQLNSNGVATFYVWVGTGVATFEVW